MSDKPYKPASYTSLLSERYDRSDNQQNLMTGQEWYERFVAEMHKQDAGDVRFVTTIVLLP